MRATACAALLLASLAPTCHGAKLLQLSKKEYDEKSEQWRLPSAKKNFLDNLDQDGVREGPAADRVWDYFKEQLDAGRVKFMDDGSVRFSNPITHFIAPYMPLIVIDLIELVAAQFRKVFYGLFNRLPLKVQHKYDVMEEDGTLAYLVIGIFVCVTVIPWAFSRLFGGISSETKKKAAYYDELKAKKAI